jgi:ABC-type nitrate/sulfonate/bicarbonate transport system substrate-binding protein
MMRRRVFVASLSFALLVLRSKMLRAATPAKVHVIVIDADGFQAFFAQDTGIFKRAGLDVEITSLTKGQAAIEAIATGNGQIGIANTLTLAQAREHGLPVAWISPAAVAVSTNPSNAFVVWPSSPIKTAKDLTGKTVGTISLSGLLRLVLNAWIDRNGGDSSAVKFVELVPAQVAPALERGTVDAATLTDPMLTEVRPQIRSIGNPFDGLGSARVICRSDARGRALGERCEECQASDGDHHEVYGSAAGHRIEELRVDLRSAGVAADLRCRSEI